MFRFVSLRMPTEVFYNSCPELPGCDVDGVLGRLGRPFQICSQDVKDAGSVLRHVFLVQLLRDLPDVVRRFGPLSLRYLLALIIKLSAGRRGSAGTGPRGPHLALRTESWRPRKEKARQLLSSLTILGQPERLAQFLLKFHQA